MAALLFFSGVAMAFTDDLTAMQAVIYGALGVPATWTPKGLSSGFCVTLLPDQADAEAQLGGFGRQAFSRNVFRVRATEIAAVADGIIPAKEDSVQLLSPNALPVGPALKILNPPDRKDSRRSEWTLECG